MRLIKNLLAAFAMIGLAVSAPLAPLNAAAVVAAPTANFHPDVRLVAINAATANYTNATTGLTDITGTSVTIPATTRDFALQYIRVCFSADATKSTSTTGSIEVYANGAAIAASKRTIASAAGQSTLSGCYTVARSSGAVQTVKLQGISGDSATFTVANAQVEVWLVQNASQ